MIFPKKKEPKMVQLNGQTGEPEIEVKGKERIFSIPDTHEIVNLGKTATTDGDYIELGHYVRNAVAKQNNRPPEYTKE